MIFARCENLYSKFKGRGLIRLNKLTHIHIDTLPYTHSTLTKSLKCMHSTHTHSSLETGLLSEEKKDGAKDTKKRSAAQVEDEEEQKEKKKEKKKK